MTIFEDTRRDSVDDVVDEDAPGLPISVPDSGDTGEGGKLKMIIQIVKKCLGVKDIAAMRLSLPASLLEPIPNLEYWQYLDRPDFFSAINDSEDPFERMLAVLRFTFTKDLKFVHGGVCKPYNSVLGEHFRAHWDVVPYFELPHSPTPSTRTGNTLDLPPSDGASVKSSRSSKSTRSGFSALSQLIKSPLTNVTSPQSIRTTDCVNTHIPNLQLSNADNSRERVRVIYVTEQVSHHPPISAYFASCPARSLELRGIDQISAKVSGTTLRVSPGEANQGLFIRVKAGPGGGEEYRITHPIAAVNGILRGSFYVTVGESTVITCSGGKRGQKFRTIIEYKEESWIGKPHFLVEGIIHSVQEGETQHEQWTKVKHVPHSHVVAVFDGSWRGSIRWRRVGLGSYPHSSVSSSPSPSHVSLLPETSISSLDVSKSASKSDIVAHDEDYAVLIDLSMLKVIPKVVRSLEKQLPNESRKLWVSVTDNLSKKEFSEATKHKVAIEQRQRDAAAERKRKGLEFIPRFFEKDFSPGHAALTAEGKAAVEEELNEEPFYCVMNLGFAKLSS